MACPARSSTGPREQILDRAGDSLLRRHPLPPSKMWPLTKSPRRPPPTKTTTSTTTKHSATPTAGRHLDRRVVHRQSWPLIWPVPRRQAITSKNQTPTSGHNRFFQPGPQFSPESGRRTSRLTRSSEETFRLCQPWVSHSPRRHRPVIASPPAVQAPTGGGGEGGSSTCRSGSVALKLPLRRGSVP